MAEVVGDAALLFDPESLDEMTAALRIQASDRDLRMRLSTTAYRRAQTYTWRRCAEDTFSFLERVAVRYATGSTS
jgi:glycosyltransferase involved in cell wall biosynthesis